MEALIEPYDGFMYATSSNKFDEVRKKLAEIIMGDFGRPQFGIKNSGKYKFYFLTGRSTLEDDIEIGLLDFPITVRTQQGDEYIVIDVRSNVKQTFNKSLRTDANTPINEYILNYHIFELQMVTAYFMIEFRLGNSPFKSYKRNIIKIFGTWLSDSISKKVYSDDRDKLLIRILGELHFYLMLVMDELRGYEMYIDKDNIDHHLDRFYTTYYVGNEEVKEVVDMLIYSGDYQGVKAINLLTDLVLNINNLSVNKNLESLDVGVLLNSLEGSWLGYNSSKIINASTSCIPIFGTLVYLSLGNKTFRKTRMSEMIKNKSVLKDGGEDFVSQTVSLIAKYEK